MKRTFIAVKIEPGEKLKEAISEIMDVLKDDLIKWVDVSNMHITVAFLGDTAEDTIQQVSEMLQKNCSGKGDFNFKLSKLGIFRSISDPRVIWAGIENSDKLLSLYISVKKGLEEIGIQTGERDFNPHLTIGRIKAIKDKNKLGNLLVKYKSTEFQNVVINDVIFYESILGHSGPTYIPLCKVKM